MSATSPSEETRSFYQQRLALTFLVGFALSVAFLVGNVAAVAAAEGHVLADLRARALHVATAVVLGVATWVLRRSTVSHARLVALDMGVVLLVSLMLAVNAGIYPIRIVSVFNLALVTGIGAVLRAVVVPSTAGRTLALGLAQGAVATAIFLLSAYHPAWPVQRGHADWPMPYQLASFGLWLGALVAIATVASRVIYRLRREVRVARQLGQYVLGDKLGEGGMGLVYRATHALLRRETALKLLPPDRVDPGTVRRFEREVVETARLRHPSTVAIYDYGRTPDGVFYYAMEYLDGLTIGELVEREGPLPPGRAVCLLAQVCGSLEEAHAMGLVHRDIKPANVMVIGRPAAWDLVKVLDFGLVKSAAPLDGGASLTVADQVTGTPLYMAPETIAQPDAAGPPSDLYAVAAVGYYMLTGHHVFERGSAIEIYAAHLHTPPTPPHERLGRALPEELERLVLRGLAKSPGDRPPSAAAFREALLRADVPAWTAEDARGWWRTRGERARHVVGAPHGVDHAPTVTIVKDRAAPGVA